MLLVDDEEQILRSESVLLKASGIKNVMTVQNSRQVLPLLDEHEIGVLVLDLVIPDFSGQKVLEWVSANHPEVPVIIVTATSDLGTAVECMRAGAIDYLLKPVEKNRLVSSVQRAMEIRVLRSEVQSLKRHLLSETLEQPGAFSAIVTQSRTMRSIFRYVEAISATPQPVLITGETGTGKELIAQAVHRLSGRQGSFVPVNVAGLDDPVFSDTLFGHRKGAYTGADQTREGLIAQAAAGTLFLDEIGDLAPSSQVKLLRLLQENRYYALGSDQPRDSTARVVVATNRDVQQMAKRGEFRKDLYYRLRAHQIQLPPLRERKEDLPLLINHFLEKAAQSLGKDTPTPPAELYTLLNAYGFPGNIRELETMVYDAVVRHQGGVLAIRSFRELLGQDQGFSALSADEADVAAELSKLLPHRLPTLKEAEEYLVAEALRRADGNQGIAAGILGLTRQALNKRLVRRRRQDRTGK